MSHPARNVFDAASVAKEYVESWDHTPTTVRSVQITAIGYVVITQAESGSSRCVFVNAESGKVDWSMIV